MFCRTKKFSIDVTVELDHRETNCFDGDFFKKTKEQYKWDKYVRTSLKTTCNISGILSEYLSHIKKLEIYNPHFKIVN